MVRTFYSSSVFEFKNLREKVETPCFLAAWIEKSKTEEILTSPSFRVLYETLNTRVKKKLREREREKRKDHGKVFSFFTESEKKKGQTFGTFFYILFIQRLFYIVHVLLSTNLPARRRTAEEKRRETIKRERWCSFCPAMVALFHPRRRVLFYHHQWEEREE